MVYGFADTIPMEAAADVDIRNIMAPFCGRERLQMKNILDYGLGSAWTWLDVEARGRRCIDKY